jgi:hypothetical protein
MLVSEDCQEIFKLLRINSMPTTVNERNGIKHDVKNMVRLDKLPYSELIEMTLRIDFWNNDAIKYN